MCDGVKLEPEPPDTGARVTSEGERQYAVRMLSKPDPVHGSSHSETPSAPVTEAGRDGIIYTEDEVTDTQYTV